MANRNDASVAARQQGLSAWGYAILSGAGLLIAIALLFVFIKAIPTLSQYGIQGNIFYVLLVPLGLSTAAFTFGAMRSYAQFKGHVFSGTVEAGGPFVAAVLVVIGGFQLTKQPESFQVVARLETLEGRPVTEGYLTIFYGNASNRQPVAANGTANFNDIPSAYRATGTKVRLESSRYELNSPETSYPLAVSPLVVQVKQQKGYTDGFTHGFAEGRIRRSLDQFFAQKHRYPATLDELRQTIDIGAYLETVGENNISYKPNEDVGFVLRFSGLDNILNTQDDRVVTRDSD